MNGHAQIVNHHIKLVGRLMTPDQATQLVLDCSIGYRLPEPTRQADLLAGKAKRKNKN